MRSSEWDGLSHCERSVAIYSWFKKEEQGDKPCSTFHLDKFTIYVTIKTYIKYEGENMVEIKNDQLIIDDKKLDLTDVNIIHQVQNNLHLSNNIVEFAQNQDVKEVFKKLSQHGYNNFMLINRAIVNLANVESAIIKYFQYAGISIYECEKKHAELHVISLNCKNGKTESISFRTFAEAEKFHQEINKKLAEKNAQTICD